eukprot:1303579-Amphidinium_carterae.3
MEREYKQHKQDMHDDENKQIVKDIKVQQRYFKNDINHYINKSYQHDEHDLKNVNEHKEDNIIQTTHKKEYDDQTLHHMTKFNKKKTKYREHEKEDTTLHHRHHSTTKTQSDYNDMKKTKYNDRQRNKKYQKNG